MSDVLEAAEASPADEVTERYRWVTLGVVLVGTLMVVLDTSIVNVALPEIRSSLSAGDGIEWVVTAYLLAVAVSQPATGWLADRFGRKRVFTWSLGCFTLASLACALAPSTRPSSSRRSGWRSPPHWPRACPRGARPRKPITTAPRSSSTDAFW